MNVIFTSCNEAPTQLGMNFLNDTVTVETIAGQDTTLISAAQSYLVSCPVETNTGSILVGATENLRAGALIRFNIPTNKTNITEEKIVSCKLYIYPQNYAIGDTANSNQLNLEIKEVVNFWTADKTSYKEVLNSNQLYNNSKNIAEWSGQIKRKDTMDAIMLDFPKQLCAEWFKKINDGVNITDTIWGIALLPKSGSTIINNFKAFSNTKITPGTMIKVTYYKDEANSVIDSLEIPTAIECSFVESKENNSNDDLIIQGGVKLHSNLTFDISRIPTLACINYAELTLTVDEAKSYCGTQKLPNKISLSYFKDTTSGERYAMQQMKRNAYYDSTTKTFTFKEYFNTPLNYFLRNSKGKGSLVLTFEDIDQETNYLNKYVFYGTKAADINKRPKLKIIYSNMNK